MLRMDSELDAYNHVASSYKEEPDIQPLEEDSDSMDSTHSSPQSSSHTAVGSRNSNNNNNIHPFFRIVAIGNKNKTKRDSSTSAWHPLDKRDTIPRTKLKSGRRSQDSFGKQLRIDVMKYAQTNNETLQELTPGGLSQQLSAESDLIVNDRDSVMDLKEYFNHLQSDTLVESYTANNSDALTLRMNSMNPKKQKRIKLYLPKTPTAEEGDIEIIMVFVNKGCTHNELIDYLQHEYPNNVLMDKINCLCIADDDGDIDDDFPPIAMKQDITDLGVEH